MLKILNLCIFSFRRIKNENILYLELLHFHGRDLTEYGNFPKIMCKGQIPLQLLNRLLLLLMKKNDIKDTRSMELVRERKK